MSVYDNALRALPYPLRAKGRSPLQPGAACAQRVSPQLPIARRHPRHVRRPGRTARAGAVVMREGCQERLQFSRRLPSNGVRGILEGAQKQPKPNTKGPSVCGKTADNSRHRVGMVEGRMPDVYLTICI